MRASPLTCRSFESAQTCRLCASTFCPISNPSATKFERSAVTAYVTLRTASRARSRLTVACAATVPRLLAGSSTAAVVAEARYRPRRLLMGIGNIEGAGGDVEPPSRRHVDSAPAKREMDGVPTD